MSEENELPRGWVQTTLGEICSQPQYGWTTKANPKSGSVRLLRTTDISSGLIDWDTVPYCTEVPENLAAYRLGPGDIVISRAGSVGVSYLLSNIPSETVFASYLIRFRPLEGAEPRYMAYYLQTPTYWASIYEQSSGIALANVNARKLEAFEIPLAPLPEQRRIVAAIEEQFTRLDAGVAALQRAKVKLKRYRAAVLKAAVEGKLTEQWRAEHPTTEPASMLLERILKEQRAQLPELPEGWCWATVEQVGDINEQIVLTGPFGSNLGTEDFIDSGVPVLTIGCLTEQGLSLEKAFYVSDEKASELGRYRVRAGDLLFSRMASVGRADLVSSQLEGSIINYHLMRLRLAGAAINPNYFISYIRGSYTVVKYIKEVNHGVTRDGINTNQLLAMPIALPPFGEQEQIVAEVERRLSVISQLEATVDADLKRAERLRQSILSEAFAGRLVLQDPNDEPASVLLERIRSERIERKNGTNKNGRSVRVPEPVTLDVIGAEQVELWENVGN